MPLTPGQSLSFYEILGPLGVGGMGEVYLARDTRLDREVAIKVLPEEFADDEERLRRFEREAKTLASLNHPNVAGIHGIDQVDDTCFLAMELVPGEDLEERLKRGALPLDEALDVCRQIAEGLEAAHEAGVVHRDLKPANVRVTPEGTVKILDFGLAKPIRPEASKSGSTSAQSDSFLVTSEGMILGTPTYMSPEQARGKPVDRRTDIWAFGCVLYECLTGQRAFRGDSMTDILAAIVGEQPDQSLLPPLPASVRTLLVRCLTKDPRVRLRDIGEARVLLQEGDLEANEPRVAGSAQARRARAALLVAGGVVLGAVLGALVFDRMSGESKNPAELAANNTEPPRVRRFSQPPTLNEKGERVPWEGTLLSPDGKSLAVSTPNGLVVRSLDSLETTQIPGAGVFGAGWRGQGAAWSPDGESIVYIEKSAIFRVTPEGGNPVQLFSASEDTRLAPIAWLDDGRILFGSHAESGVSLQAIPEGGGPATEMAVLGASMSEGHLHGICAVPGGRFIAVLHSFLGDKFSVLTEGNSGVRELFTLPGEHIPSAIWAPGDYLLFNRGASEDADELWAVPLSEDPMEVTGEPFFVQRGVRGASISTDGTLAYVEKNEEVKYQLAWWSADGTTEPFEREHERGIRTRSLSLEQDCILYLVGNSMPFELWSYDLRRGVSTEVATGDHRVGSAQSLPDGRIAYSALDMSPEGVSVKSYLLPASGRGESKPWIEAAVMDVTESHALVAVIDGEGLDIFVDDLATLERRVIRADLEDNAYSSISPDGEWVLFWIGREVVLTRFPSGEGEWQVSTEGGTDAAFAPDGSAIYFVADRALYRVSLQTEPGVLLGAPELIGRAEEGTHLTGMREKGSDRFLATHAEGSADGNLVVVLGWTSELAGR